jgi:hypothetical protein
MKRRNCIKSVRGAVQKLQECMIILIALDPIKNRQDNKAFLLYCFKIFASERIPNKIKSKGFCSLDIE